MNDKQFKKMYESGYEIAKRLSRLVKGKNAKRYDLIVVNKNARNGRVIRKKLSH